MTVTAIDQSGMLVLLSAFQLSCPSTAEDNNGIKTAYVFMNNFKDIPLDYFFAQIANAGEFNS